MTELSYSTNQEMTLRDYVRILFRQKWVIVLSFIIVMSIVFYGLTFRTPTYQASVKMLVSGQKQVDAPYYKELLNFQQTQVGLTQMEVVTSDPVILRAVYALYLDHRPTDYEKEFASPLKRKWINFQNRVYITRLKKFSPQERELLLLRRAVEQLRSNIKVEAVKDTNIFVIRVKDFDPIKAAITANVVSRSYVIFDLEQQMAELKLKYGQKHPVVIQLQDNIQHMKEGLNGNQLPNEDAIGTASVKIIEQANVPLNPVGLNNKVILLVAILMSLFFGIVLAFILEYLDQNIKSPQDLEMNLRIPYFGGIPKLKLRRNHFVKGALSKRIPKKYRNAFRILADQLYLMIATNPFKVLLLASSGKEDNSSLVAAHLGYHLADHASKRVIIIDANCRDSNFQQIFNLNQPLGLMDVLQGKASLDQTICVINDRLSVLPSGRSDINPMILFDSPAVKELLGQLKKQYDLVLIDTPELKSYQDGCILASLADKTIFIVSENQTRKQAAVNALASLRERNISILGAILKDRNYHIPTFIYGRV